jgi:tetratricopeptide (TPR) repeat protein
MSRIGQIIGVAILTVGVAGGPVSPARGGQQPVSPEVVERFRAGQQDLRSGKLHEAVGQFQAVLRLAPGLSEARINLGLAYHLLGEYRLAVAELESGLEQSPNVLGGNIVLGADELKLGSPAKAVPPLRRAVKLDPSNPHAWNSLGDAYLDLGDYLEASRAYNAAFGKNSTPGNWLHLGHAYLRMSTQLTAQMAHQYADTPWAKRLTGDLLSERHMWSDAARRYQLALALDPAEPGLHSSLAHVLLEQGKTVRAEEEFQNEIEIDPASPRALAGLAEVELELGHADRALRYASKLVTTAPQLALDPMISLPARLPPALAAKVSGELANAQSEPGAHFLLAGLYRVAGKPVQSREQQALSRKELKRLAEAQRPAWRACEAHQYGACIRFLGARRRLDEAQLTVLGQALLASRRYGEAGNAFAASWAQKHDSENLYWLIRSYSKMADRCFSALAGRYPNSAQAYELRAESYRARGEDSKAVKQYQLAAAMQPDNASLHEALGELYLNEHRVSGAQKELEKALELDPANARALYLMGRVKIGFQKPQTAIPYLEKALHYDPHLISAHASLGLAYLRAGKPALAVPQLEQSASLDYYGDLHYMLYQAYSKLGKTALAGNALAVSQALRRKTESRDQALIRSAEDDQ